MAFTPEDVLNKNFTATQFRRGYDEHEVDDFLDEIVVELRRLSNENEDLSKQLKICQELTGGVTTGVKGEKQDARAGVGQAEKDSGARFDKAKADVDQGLAQVAERAKAAGKSANETGGPESAAVAATGKGESAPEVDAARLASLGSAAGVLALAERLHSEHVAKGQETRDRLISEGQSHHDKVVGEATAKQKELLSTGQAKYDELMSVGGAKHDALIAEATARHEKMINEARERASVMVTEAQQKRTTVLATLDDERGMLQRKVEELKTFERDYRARLKSHLESQLNHLEQIGAEDSARKSDGDGDAKQRAGQRAQG